MTAIQRAYRSGFAASAILSVAALAPPARGDQSNQPTSADQAAAQSATTVFRRALRARTPAGAKASLETIRVGSHAAGAPGPLQGAQPRYPGDLTYLGGEVVGSAQSHAIYVENDHCNSPSCWGNPETFLQDLGQSDLIQVTNQYVNRSDSNRYTVGSNASIHPRVSPTPTPYTDLDMLAMVHSVAKKNHQTGYGHIYHVFLPPGQDECFDNTFTVCYSPDNLASAAFCAYHSSVDFQDIGHVLYTVEPYQNVMGCNDRPDTPNGQLVDSTNDVLSHELFETITDPDGLGWWNTTGFDMLGSEIGDECIFIIAVPNILDPNAIIYGDPDVVNLGGKTYAVQPEYSNSSHACAASPRGGDQ